MNDYSQLKKPSFYVWLSHDVDWVKKDYIHSLYGFLKYKRTYHLKELFRKENRYWNFDKIVKLESEFGAKSTFFFLHETMGYDNIDTWFKARYRYSLFNKEIQDEIICLDELGWEVGLHGSYYSYKRFDLLKQEKEILESILKKNVIGVRQHYLNLDVPKTWEYQYELGFKYDSSFGLKRDVGFKGNIYTPFSPFQNSFKVFPLVLMEGYLEMVSKNNIEKAKKIIDELIQKSIRHNAVLSVLWHNRSIDEKEYPILFKLYIYIMEQTLKNNGEFILPDEYLKKTL
jgi:peptidoglycan/xylan/chitin deacetylase (PgdA/CDA1 family)